MRARRRTLRSPEEIREILAEHRSSGQSVRAFALERGIPVSTLALWTRRYAAVSPALIPLRVREPEDHSLAPRPALSVRIELAGGVTIAIDGVSRPGELRAILSELDLP